MFALVKPFLLSLAVIIFLLFAIGVIKVKKTDYACFHGKQLHFTDKVQVMDVGMLKVYAYPLVADCTESERYNPSTVYKCGDAVCQQ